MLLSLLVSSALALDLDTFRPAAPCGGGLQLAATPAPGTACGGLLGAYAHHPLVERWEHTDTPVIATSAVTHLVAAYSLPGAVLLAVDLPLYPYVGAPGGAIDGSAVGDVAVSAVLGAPALGLDLRLLPRVTLPTGSTDALVGAGGLTAALGVGAARAVGRVELSGEVSLVAAPSAELRGLSLGSLVHAAAGARFVGSERAAIGMEVDGDLSLVGPLSGAEVPVEAHVYGEYTVPAGLRVLAGAGTGLLAGVGAPELRFVLGVGWAGRLGRPPVAYFQS